MKGPMSKAEILRIDEESEIVRFFGKAFEPNEGVRFRYALSGRADPDVRRQRMGMGVRRAFFEKPVDIEHVIEGILSWITKEES